MTTCTVYVDNENGDEIASESYDTIELALENGIKIAKSHIENKKS